VINSWSGWRWLFRREPRCFETVSRIRDGQRGQSTRNCLEAAGSLDSVTSRSPHHGRTGRKECPRQTQMLSQFRQSQMRLSQSPVQTCMSPPKHFILFIPCLCLLSSPMINGERPRLCSAALRHRPRPCRGVSMVGIADMINGRSRPCQGASMVGNVKASRPALQAC